MSGRGTDGEVRMRSQRAAWAAGLVGATGLGLGLRLYRLGALGFSGNEDYLAISARAVQEHLVPLFPSGIVYPRALPYTYLAALLVRLFDLSEFVLRLPGALFSTASILLVWYLGRRLVDPAVGLAAAFLFAVSDWEVLMSHTARMYPMFSFCVLAALVLAYKAGRDEARWARPLALASVLLACFLHQIAAALFLMLGCLALYLFRAGARYRFVLVCAATVLIGFAANYAFERYHYNHWSTVVSDLAPAGAAADDSAPGGGPAALLRQRAFPLLVGLREDVPALFAVAGVLAAAALLLALTGLVRRRGARVFCLALAAVVLVTWAQQSMLALACVLLYVAVGRRFEPERYHGRTWILAAVAAAGALLWLAYGILSPPFPAAAVPQWTDAARKSLGALLFYPPSFGRIFVERYPGLALLAFGSALLSARRYLAAQRITGAGLVGLWFVVPVFLLGFSPQALARTYERYVYFLNPYFLIMAAHGALWLLRAARDELRRRSAPLPLRGAAVIALALFLAAGTGLGSLRQTRPLLGAEYGENRAVRGSWREEALFNPDHKGPALYVERNRRPGDLVVAMDILAHYSYSPHADFQLTVSRKRDAEGWIGVPTLDSAAALERLLDRSPGRRVWVVLAGNQLRDFAGDPALPAILELLRRRGGEPVYRGRDGLSDVYRLGGGPAPGQSANGSLPK